jgi:hypothetical protein
LFFSFSVVGPGHSARVGLGGVEDAEVWGDRERKENGVEDEKDYCEAGLFALADEVVHWTQLATDSLRAGDRRHTTEMINNSPGTKSEGAE